MTNINPSPILNDFPTRRASISQQREIPSETEKPEGKKTVNKALIGAAAAAGLAAIAFAGISMLRKGKMPEEVQKVIQSAEEFLQKANRTAIVEEVNKISEEIRSIFEKGAENGYQDVVDENGNLLRRFELRNGTPQRLIEYGEDGGPVVRETGIKSFKDFEVHDKVNNKKIRIRNGRPEKYIEGFEKLSDGGSKEVKVLRFYDDGKPDIYHEGVEYLSDGTEKIARVLLVDVKGRPGTYFEGFEKLSDRSSKIKKKLLLNDDGRPNEYIEGVEQFSDRTIKTAKRLSFENGKPYTYLEGDERLPDGTDKIAKRLSFDDGKPYTYREGDEKLPDGITRNTAKALDFENGSPSSYAEGVKIHFRYGDITITEKSSIKLINGKWVKQN